MNIPKIKVPVSHGTGEFNSEDFRLMGKDVIIENGVLVFHPENISIFDKVYIGHNTLLKAYYKNEMTIGEGTWIGQSCFFHSAGGIHIGKSVGIGPCVKIISSSHEDKHPELPVMYNPLVFGPVVIGNGADIGVGTIILPNVSIGEGAIVGAGSVVTRDIEPYSVYAGVPAKFLRKRVEDENSNR